MPESRAEIFFNDFMASSNKADFLRKLADPNSNTFEDEYLEFKSGQTPGHNGQAPRPLDPKLIKDKWSETLSAFANTSGGVLVWGIDCRKTTSPVDSSKTIDVANGVLLVPDPVALKSELMTLHHNATEPGVGGVRVEAVCDTSGAGGFVVCLIPESPYKPHRALHVKNSPYCLRIGDDSVVAPHGILRSLFFPHTHSYLWVEIGADGWMPTGATGSTSYEVRITNSGPATARDVYVVLQTESRLRPLEAGVDWTWTFNPQGQYAFECKRPLHPGTVSQVFTAYEELPLAEIAGLKNPANDVKFRLLIYAADQDPRDVEISLMADDIANKASKSGKPRIGDWYRVRP